MTPDGQRTIDRGDAEVDYKAGSIWAKDGTPVKGNEFTRADADRSAEEATWAEALRTGQPLVPPPGYEVVEEEVGVVGPGGQLVKIGGGS